MAQPLGAGVAPPPSLQNIFKEIEALQVKLGPAEQGILDRAARLVGSAVRLAHLQIVGERELVFYPVESGEQPTGTFCPYCPSPCIASRNTDRSAASSSSVSFE